MHKPLGTFGTLIGLAAAAFSPGCRQQAALSPPPQQSTGYSYNRMNNFKDCGNGVWTYPNFDDFPYALADFRAAHNDTWRIVSVTQGVDHVYIRSLIRDVKSEYGANSNFVIVAEQIQK